MNPLLDGEPEVRRVAGACYTLGNSRRHAEAEIDRRAFDELHFSPARNNLADDIRYTLESDRSGSRGNACQRQIISAVVGLRLIRNHNREIHQIARNGYFTWPDSAAGDSFPHLRNDDAAGTLCGKRDRVGVEIGRFLGGADIAEIIDIGTSDNCDMDGKWLVTQHFPA